MSAKIPPSERIRQLVEGYLQGGYQQSEQSASEFLKLAAQMVAQEALEQEVTDFLGRERYERQEETVGYRNGYKPGRMRSAEGEIELSVPQVRETEQPYRSRLMEFFKGNTDVLDDLEASLAFLRCPITHHRRIRTTNLIERAFAEQRRRTNIDRNEFTRLTRRALSHLPNLPRLAASPLTELGIVTACVDEDADTLQRAHALRRILVESINELRPVDRGEYGTTDEWRFFNVLYYPYVAGISPYRRALMNEVLPGEIAEAVTWFRTMVPQRTMHNWQNQGAALIADILLERERSLAAENSQ